MTERPAHPLIPADRVNGTDVYNSAGEKLGKIEDIAIDKVSGKVAYAILSHGGVLGMGEHYHPVPWDLMSYDVDKRGYIVPCGKDELERAPAIHEQELSGWNDGQARDSIYSYYAPYGVGPYWA